MRQQLSKAYVDGIHEGIHHHIGVSHTLMAILKFVENTSFEQMQFLSPTTFANIAYENKFTPFVQEALNMCVEQDIFKVIRLLESDEEGNEFSEELTQEEYDEILSSGFAVHPDTGNEIKNYEKYIVTAYAINELAFSNSQSPQNGDIPMTDDTKHQHTITGDDVPADTAPTPAEKVSDEKGAQPGADRPADSQDDKDD